MDQEEFDKEQEDDPVVDNDPVESDVNEELDQVLKDLEASEPEKPEPPPQEKIEPPDVGQLMEANFDSVEEKIGSEESFEPESPDIPEDPPDIEIQNPTEVLADESPDTLLEHFKNLVEKDQPEKFSDESVSLPELSAEYEDMASGFQNKGDSQQSYMDADYRNRDSTAHMLIDHARRIDELTELQERIRL